MQKILIVGNSLFRSFVKANLLQSKYTAFVIRKRAVYWRK